MNRYGDCESLFFFPPFTRGPKEKFPGTGSPLSTSTGVAPGGPDRRGTGDPLSETGSILGKEEGCRRFFVPTKRGGGTAFSVRLLSFDPICVKGVLFRSTGWVSHVFLHPEAKIRNCSVDPHSPSVFESFTCTVGG